MSAEALQPWFAGLLDLALALQLGAWILRGHVPGGLPRLLLPASLGLLAIGLLGLLWMEAAAMSGTALDEAQVAIPTMLGQTGFGHMCLLAVLAWCGLLLAFLILNRLVAWLALAVFFCARAAMGHAMDQGWASYAIWVHALHIAAGAGWVGIVLLAAGLMRSAWSAAQLSAFAQCLSRVATLALVVVAASGAIDAWRMLAISGISFDDAYTQVLGAKLACVVLAVCMGAWNRWGVMPRLKQEVKAARRFAWVLLLEGAVLLAAMSLAAKLGTTMPPMVS